MDNGFAGAVGAKDITKIMLCYSVGLLIGAGLFAVYCHFVPA